MEFPKNQWVDLVVQGVHLGKVLHVYEEYYKDEQTPLRDYGYLVKTNVRRVNEYYCIDIDNRFTGVWAQSIALEKDIFEKLVNSPFTRIVDYFVMARDIIYVGDAHGLGSKAFARSDEDDDDIAYFSIRISHEGEIDDLYIACTKQYSKQ
jgi:hypothetical protein